MNKKLLFLSVFLLVCLFAPNVLAQETINLKRNLWSVDDRKDWKLSASSAQGLSDGGKGGPTSLLVDGKSDSYWHSVWDTNVLPGVTIDVDFGKTLVVNSILFQQRNMETRMLKTIKFYFKQNA